MEYRSTCLCASGKKLKKFSNFLSFRAMFGAIFRVMVFKKILEMRKLARHFNCFVSEFVWGKYIFSTFPLISVKIVHVGYICMYFLKMIFLRRELMKITFSVGSYT